MPRPAEIALNGPDLAALAEAQDHVVSVAQLAELGIERRVVRRRDGRVWQLLGPHVVVLHTGPLSRRQRWWSGVLHGGAGAALCGLTALEADGLRGFEMDEVHVLAPHGQGRRNLKTDAVRIRVFESASFTADVNEVRTPARTRPARSTVDAASRAATDDRCRAIVAATVQQRLVLPPALRAGAEQRLRIPRRKLILETIDDVEGGSHSVPELQFLSGLRRYGLPQPTRQAVVVRLGGRYYLDARFDRWKVAVEVNGLQHLELLAREADDERRLALSTGGLLVVDLSSYLVRHQLGTAMLRTARALHSRGWEPGSRALERLGAVAAGRGEPLWLPVAA